MTGRTGRKRHPGVLATMTLVVVAMSVLAPTGLIAANAAAPSAQITICHRTNSASNPYVVITTDRSGADGIIGNEGGRADHFAEHDDGPDGMFDPAIHSNGDDWDDIIPPVDDDGVAMPHDGLNWTETNSTGQSGEDIWLNGCRPLIPTPNVAIEKTASLATVEAGSDFTWHLTVTNTTTFDAEDVVITDTIASSLTIGTLPAGCTRTGQAVTCDVGTLAGGASRTFAIPVTTSTASCPSVDNTGTVTAASDSDPNDNSDSTSVSVTCPTPNPDVSVSLTKTNDANDDGRFTDSEEAKRAGLDVPFRVVITNTSTVDVAISDLTDAFDQTTLDLLDAHCSNLSSRVLAAGESVTCTFTLRNYSPPSDAGSKVNTAEVCVEAVDGTNTDCDSDTSNVRSAEVLGRTVTPPPTRTPPGGTAFTGSEDALSFGLMAVALLLFGSGVMYVGYRKRERYEG